MIEARIESPCATITIVHLSGTRMASDAYVVLCAARAEAIALGSRALLFDLAGVRRVLASGIGALVELASLDAGPDILLCGASEDATRLLKSLGLDRSLPVFTDSTAALATPAMRRHQLSALRAVILGAGADWGQLPQVQSMPVSMLDVLGQPALRRNLDHLSRSGIQNCIVDTGQHAHLIGNAFRNGRIGGLNVFLSAQGEHRGNGWHSTSCGSATLLGRLFAEGNLTGDTLVIRGDSLSNIDIGAMYSAHCSSRADVTVAAANVTATEGSRHTHIVTDSQGGFAELQSPPHHSDARTILVDRGIYVIGPRALKHAGLVAGCDIACDLLPELMAVGLHVQVFDRPFQWIGIDNPHSYFRALDLSLSGRIDGILPVGIETRGGLWVAPGAVIAPGAVVHGPCFVGSNARIGAGVEILGPSIICEGAVIEGPSLIRSSVILPRVSIGPGSTVIHEISDGVSAFSLSEAAPVALETVRRVNLQLVGAR